MPATYGYGECSECGRTHNANSAARALARMRAKQLGDANRRRASDTWNQFRDQRLKTSSIAVKYPTFMQVCAAIAFAFLYFWATWGQPLTGWSFLVWVLPFILGMWFVMYVVQKYTAREVQKHRLLLFSDFRRDFANEAEILDL